MHVPQNLELPFLHGVIVSPSAPPISPHKFIVNNSEIIDLSDNSDIFAYKFDSMADKCCGESENNFELEAVISFDERGQLVLPKDVRAKFNLEAGEKFALVSCTNNGELCCFNIIKTSMLSQAFGRIVNLK